MKTSELIEFLKTRKFTRDQAYNLVINDLFEAATEEQIASVGGQKLISYFMYKIQEVLLPVIEELRNLSTEE